MGDNMNKQIVIIYVSIFKLIEPPVHKLYNFYNYAFKFKWYNKYVNN